MKKNIIIVLLILANAFFWIQTNSSFKKPSPSPPPQTVDCEKANWQKCLQFTPVDLPLNYFSPDDLVWGHDNGSGKLGMDRYALASIDNKTVYQSYPTTNIRIKKFSSQKTLINPPDYSQVKNQLGQAVGFDSPWVEEIFEKNCKDYQKLALHFLSQSRVIEDSNSFDVDGDGQKEQIITTNDFGRADGGSPHSSIIKNNLVIFSANEDGSKIVTADTADGFYVEWRLSDDDSPRCCPAGYFRTRFVNLRGEFVPVYEQEIRYFVVGKDID